jgi:hypothetical protein
MELVKEHLEKKERKKERKERKHNVTASEYCKFKWHCKGLRNCDRITCWCGGNSIKKLNDKKS